MKETVRQFLSRYTKMITPFNLGIANAALLSREDLIGCLNERLLMIDETVLHVESMRESRIAEARPYYVIALFDRSLAHLRTERDWVAGFIRNLKDMTDATGLTKEREPGTDLQVYRYRRI